MDRTELIERPAAELEDGIGQLHALHVAVLSHLMEFIAAYDAKEAWVDDGATSMTAWLAARLRVTHETAASWVRVAKALADLPCIAHALSQGGVAFEQVEQLVRFATPETDAALAEEASRYSAAQLRRMARRHREVTCEEDDEPHRLRRFRLRWDHDRRTLLLSGRLPATEGAVVEKALDDLVKQAPPDPETGWYEDVDTRRADALVEVCSRAIADEADADRATVSVHVDGEVLASGVGSAEVETGPALSVDAALRVACDSRWQLIVHGPDGLPVAMGRTTRQVPRRLMRQLRHRDGGCRFPGCGRKGWVAAHHVKHWARGGRTDLDNLLLLCGKHHRLVHEGGWSVDWSEDDREPAFVRPDGSVYEARPPPLRPEIRDRIIGTEDDAQAS